jgi:hypothetical protein
MRKYSTDRARANEFGGTIHTSPSNSTNDFGSNVLGVDDRVEHIREDPEFARDAHVVAVRADPVGDHPLTHLAALERLDHAMLERHASNPAVGLNGHLGNRD